MNDSEKYIQIGRAQNPSFPSKSGGKICGKSNTPKQYIDRKHQYLAKPTRMFIGNAAKYASDFVEAKVQGLTKDFYSYLTTNIRFSDAHSTYSETSLQDDSKIVLFAEPKIDYFPIGAKLQTMGNTWLCVNPSNMSSVYTNALIKRCNAVYNSYDFYGNILREAIIVESPAMSGNDNEVKDNVVLMDGYFNVTCQLNENTMQLGQNRRILLGSKAYHITGFQDFLKEFASEESGVTDSDVLNVTFDVDVEKGVLSVGYPKSYAGTTFLLSGDNDAELTAQTKPPLKEADLYLSENASKTTDGELYAGLGDPFEGTSHLLRFTIRIEEPTEDDDLERHIANGNNYSFSAEVIGAKSVTVNDTVTLQANFMRNGEVVQNTAKHPVSWYWLSSDTDTATVTENGVVTGIKPGNVQIIAYLAQNPSVTSIFEMEVMQPNTASYVQFTSVVPQSLEQFDSVQISASYYENGSITDNAIEWEYSGADASCYRVEQSGNTISLTCVIPSREPLIVTAKYGDLSESVQIELEGY